MSQLKYPKLLLFACSLVLAYLLYVQGTFDILPQLLHGRGYISMLLGGMLFSYGFTTAFAIAIFIAMADQVNPFLGAIVAGAGALSMDLTIFHLVRCSFRDEIHRLSTSRIVLWMISLIHEEQWPRTLKRYFLWSFAGLVIASPLPDEIGVTMLGSITKIDKKTFAVLCYVFNTIGILTFLLLGRAA